MFVISVKTLEELRNVIIRETFRSNNVNPSDMKGLRDTNYASFAAIMRQALNSYDNYIKKLENQPSFYPEPVGEINSDLIKKSEELHIKYNFPGPADSVQLALALQNEVSYFATTDSDFGYVTENSLDILLDGCAYRKYQNKITNI
jgi:Predicted nucleic acid-binding protein, contains PIN domain